MASTKDKDFQFYFAHQKFITFVQWHHYLTAFFLLWGLASDLEASIDHLIASKFLHCIIPTVVINLWHTTHSPIFQYKMALQLSSFSFQPNPHQTESRDFTTYNTPTLRYDDRNADNRQHVPSTTTTAQLLSTKLKTKYKKMVRRNTFKMCCWFALLLLIDIGFFFGKLVPVGVTIYSSTEGHTGGSEWLLYTLTLLVALIQIIFTIFVIVSIRQMGMVVKLQVK
jgi:hypothetical protein